MKTLSFLFLSFISFSISSQSMVSKTTSILKDSDGFSDFGSTDDWFEVTEVNLYGGGALVGLVTADDDMDEAASPTGSIGINFKTKRLTCNLFFSYNSKQTIKVDSLNKFGNSLMNPNLGGHSFSFSAVASLKKYYGISASFQIADNVWELENSNQVDASPLIFRFGIYVNPFRFDLSENNVKIIFDAHYTHRSILGDFNNNDQIIEGNVISPKGYNGFDFSINAYLNSVKIYVQFSSNSRNGLIIPGFSGSQVLFGVDVAGTLLKLI